MRGRKALRGGVAAMLVGGAVLACVGGASARTLSPTPEAWVFTVVRETDTELAYGFGEPLPGRSDRIGVYVHCLRGSGRLRAGMFFGAFPAGKRVQAAVRGADGMVERFGPVVVGSPTSGFHDPLVEKHSDVLRLLSVAFTEGALLSNGHNSVWNRIPAAENRRVREAIVRCAGQ